MLADFDAGRRTALARVVSMVENRTPGFETALAHLNPRVGRAERIGMTGPPGAGKSTLSARLLQWYRARGQTVAVVAVDPTSSVSGGALLGDRIRMETDATDDGVFVRSMATRGATGGLALTTHEVCDVFDAFGFDRIVVETLGVGQAELAIASTADTAVLVLVPESGDAIQVLKAGVMEVADIYVVNKADRPGAGALAAEVRDMLQIRTERQGASPIGWDPPVLETIATRYEGIDALGEAIERRAEALRASGARAGQRRERLRAHAREVVERVARDAFWSTERRARFERGIDEVLGGSLSVYQLAEDLVGRGPVPHPPASPRGGDPANNERPDADVAHPESAR